MIEALIDDLATSWIVSEGLQSVSDINSGLCADFANALTLIVPELEIVGIYDAHDLSELPGPASFNFKSAVYQDVVAHTAIVLSDRFYDAECPAGVTRFEDLPIVQRALRESIELSHS